MGLVFSGVQPTGNLHLGNYLGAIKNWVKMQEEHDCIYCIVDLHAITVPQDPEVLRRSTLEVAAAFLACGIDPKHSIVFNQSMVSIHAELAWILSCHTPIGWLNRMTQFKEKAGKKRDNAMLALFSYPVLMAADILAYRATHVPVGHDQKQHLELSRDIAGAFNRYYGQDYFPLPEPIIQGEATRVMSLRDGTRKMSKSEPSEYSRINLTDDAETITAKIRKAKSDSLPEITYDPENRPEVANLINIYAALADKDRDSLCREYQGRGFADLKKDLAEVAVSALAPITQEMRKLLDNEDYVRSILRGGTEKANDLAAANLSEIKKIVGFLRV